MGQKNTNILDTLYGSYWYICDTKEEFMEIAKTSDTEVDDKFFISLVCNKIQESELYDMFKKVMDKSTPRDAFAYFDKMTSDLN